MSDPAHLSKYSAHSTTLPRYIGRFAPSPSGPLHMGSLIAALASYLDARSNNGIWLLRMEDLDPPRESVEAADQILAALEALGLHWDGPILYQSQRQDAYREAVSALRDDDVIFACNCSRQQVIDNAGVYPGTCRDQSLQDGQGIALRCKVADVVMTFDDQIQGRQQQHLQTEAGDFVIRRKDGLFAYQLAVVVDDGFQDITHIVRGIDLMDSTPRQLYLQQCLGLPHPRYAHIPVIVNAQGQKLSKQHMAAPIDPATPATQLYTALGYLQQSPDPALANALPEDIIGWGIDHWSPAPLRDMVSLRANT